MRQDQIIEIEHACSRLVIDFHYHADRFEHEEMAELFAEDATFDHVAMGLLRGKPAIRAYFLSKDSSAVTQHVTTNIRITVLDENRAKGNAYWTFYGSAPGSTVPVPLNGPMAVGQYEDEFARTPAGWRFSHRHSWRVFRASHHGEYVLLKKNVAA